MLESILEFCGAVSIIGGAIGLGYKGFKEVRKPNQILVTLSKHEDRICSMEQKQNETHEELLRVKRMQLANGRCMLAMLDHLISGNHVDNLKGVRKELQQILIENE